MGTGFLLGLITGPRHPKFKNFLVDIILYGIIPLFVLQILWETKITGFEAGFFFSAALLTVLIGIFISFVLGTNLKESSFRDIVLPVAFMNSGNLGIPAAGLVFGSRGIIFAVIFNASITFLIFTAGVLMVSGKGRIGEVFRIPVIYALAAGIILNRWGPSYPHSNIFFEIFKNWAVFLMLALVGWRLSSLKMFLACTVILAAAARFTAGFLSALILIFILPFPVCYAAPAALLALMPSAVNSYILSEKYNNSPGVASGAVALSTFLFILTFTIIY